jgi:hypothetical protein
LAVASLTRADAEPMPAGGAWGRRVLIGGIKDTRLRQPSVRDTTLCRDNLELWRDCKPAESPSQAATPSERDRHRLPEIPEIPETQRAVEATHRKPVKSARRFDAFALPADQPAD